MNSNRKKIRNNALLKEVKMKIKKYLLLPHLYFEGIAIVILLVSQIFYKYLENIKIFNLGHNINILTILMAFCFIIALIGLFSPKKQEQSKWLIVALFIIFILLAMLLPALQPGIG